MHLITFHSPILAALTYPGFPCSHFALGSCVPCDWVARLLANCFFFSCSPASLAASLTLRVLAASQAARPFSGCLPAPPEELPAPPEELHDVLSMSRPRHSLFGRALMFVSVCQFDLSRESSSSLSYSFVVTCCRNRTSGLLSASLRLVGMIYFLDHHPMLSRCFVVS